MPRVVGLFLVLSLLPCGAGAQTSTTASNKAVARRYFDDILNQGNVLAIDAIIAPDVVFRNPPAVVTGIDGFRKLVATLRTAIPDLRFTLQDELAEGEKVATRWVMRGTRDGKKIDVTGMDIFLIAGGKIREVWVNMDSLGQAQQMGLVPAAPAP